jgi:cyclopropane fatty-acyl-phospholipid synthase-like methyltransferase
MSDGTIDFTEGWRKIESLDAAEKLIMAGNQKFAPTPALENLPLQECKVILDFGCGVGRNIPALMRGAPTARIIGYDLSEMQKFALEYLNGLGIDGSDRIEWVSPPPTKLRNFTFDFIVADLTFQHIAETELRSILLILRDQMEPTGRLWVGSRSWSDDSLKSVWEVILDYFYPITFLDLQAAVGDNHQHVTFRPRHNR